MKTYKIIQRKYINDKGKEIIGKFIARGQWANGHLAYSLLDNNGNEIEGEECAYFQIRFNGELVMERV